MRRLAYPAAALLAASLAWTACGSPSAPAADGASHSPGASQGASDGHAASDGHGKSDGQAAGGSPVWQLKWQTDFAQPAPLGSFSGCDNYDRTPGAYCSGLPADLQWQWWAYPAMWPDTATERHKTLGGYYDPAHTVWISGGQMHIRLFRTTSWIHSAAVVPRASIGLLYGKYVESFEVSPGSAPGYRGAHLLWPTSEPLNYEVDYPENEWDLARGFCAYVHSVREKTVAGFCPNATWTQWHTTEIDWWPGNLSFYLDGRQIYHRTGNWVPDEPMSWIIQNESALFGTPAPDNSAAQLNLSYVAVYSYAGEQG